MKLDVTEQEAEELLAGLRFRHYQDRTEKDLIYRIAMKIEHAGQIQHGWSPGVWSRTKHPPVKVSIKAI